jgi:hypothetical protein
MFVGRCDRITEIVDKRSHHVDVYVAATAVQVGFNAVVSAVSYKYFGCVNIGRNGLQIRV